MRVHSRKTQFGWKGDGGLGERLISQIIRGEKRATCAPMATYSKEELEETYEKTGKLVTVVNQEGEPRCNILCTDVFETTFGHPDNRLVEGECEENAEAFRRSHREAWKELIAKGLNLDDDTVLVVELFELVAD